MPIQKNHKGGSGNRISEPGEYVVSIVEMKTGPTKTSKKPMLTVVMSTDDEKKISGYYVQGLDFHMAALKDLKVSCGLKPDSPAENLLGKRCGIAVESQEPTEDGTRFMRIVGYGKPSDVEGHQPPPPSDTDHIPF